ncbi:Von Willebrand factor type A domain protein (plasmid) [Sinorhizobium americanum]|uniref:von Willebrand factor type A domain protein n=1 Tax=Sinorhizobium americanum TaxID=194963 RepID=A0A1L3LTV3_9HYPH|nr:Von Willebrand factor type A domain protein [Sinorhizobium americanum]
MDVALVLAVDASGSIDDTEYAFQREAIASAFRDEHVVAAIKSVGVMAAGVMFWGDGEFPAQRIDWTIIEGSDDAEGFAQKVESNKRTVFGNTDIGSGIWAALDMLTDPRLCASRLIVNVSGDGKETIAPKRRHVATLDMARRRAEEMDVTVNALVLADEERDLASYYKQKVIVGNNAFVMSIDTYSDYASAIRKKLIREIPSQSLAQADTPEW